MKVVSNCTVWKLPVSKPEIQCYSYLWVIYTHYFYVFDKSLVFFARVTIPVEKNEGGQLAAAAAAEAATPKSREMGWIPR